MTDSRERFEAHYASLNDGSYPSCLDGEYDYAYAQACWLSWQAAERQALERAADTVDGFLDDFISNAQGRVLIDAANAIRSLIPASTVASKEEKS